MQKRQEKLFNLDVLEHFREIWSHFDPQGTGYLKISQLKDLLSALGPPIGFSKDTLDDEEMQD